MPFDPLFFVLAVPAVLLAGISKGGFGSGASFVAVPILAAVVEPAVALAVLLPLLMVIDVAALRAYWKRWDRAESLLLVAGAVPGVMLAAAFWRIADADAVRLFIGCIALAYVGWHVAVRLRPAAAAPRAPPPRGAGLAAGAAAGFSSFVSNAGGPPVAAYLLARGLGKTGYQATTVLVFWIINIMKAVSFTGLGLFTGETMTAALMLVPAALAGTWLGVRAHRVVSERLFFAITVSVLGIAGARLVWQAIA
jgi:hypothetical protein